MFRSFTSKIICLFAALVLVSQIASLIPVIITSDRLVKNGIEQDLFSGAELFERLLEFKAVKLLDSAEVLTSDFGFKEAVATGDKATIRSVLVNHGARIEADLVILSSLSGQLLVSTTQGHSSASLFHIGDMIEEAASYGHSSAITMIDGQAYQVVIVPVRAPVAVAWVVMGFELNVDFANSLKKLTGLDVTFVGLESDFEEYIASTLPPKLVPTIPISNVQGSSIFQPYESVDKYLLHSQRLPSINGEVGAVLQTSLTKALAPYKKALLSMVIIGVAVLLFTILVSIGLSRNITRPIISLANAARKIEQGIYNHFVNIRSADEIGQLASAFNHMQSGIADRETRIFYHAHHDPLTGLPNRVLALDRLKIILSRAHRNKRKVSLILFDLNKFKQINDTMGHHIGDQVLQEVASRLSGRIRASDIIARLGGDEFLIIMDETSRMQAQAIAREIAETLCSAIKVDDQTLVASASIGIVEYPEHGERPDVLLRRADMAMYQAKSLSTEKIFIYEPGIDEGYARQIAIVSDLGAAIEQDQFALYLQPKRTVSSGLIEHAEALIRWHHPKHGFISPNEFIPLLEEARSITQLTYWVLEKSVAQIAAWKQRNISINVAINLSPIDLGRDHFVDKVRSILDANDVLPREITLEITETAMMEDMVSSLKNLQELKDMGISIAMDDYGTGYSTLSQLKNLQVSELKIDRSLITGIKDGSDESVIVRSTIEMAHNIGLKVVAEGVENESEYAVLTRFECDYMQGYYLSKPLPVDQFEEWFFSIQQEQRTNQLKLASVG